MTPDHSCPVVLTVPVLVGLIQTLVLPPLLKHRAVISRLNLMRPFLVIALTI